MISAGDFRKGVTIEYNNNVYVVVEFQHVKPGKGAAFVRTKLKNVVTGAVLEQTFNPSEKVENAHIETKKMTYSYTDGELYWFMDDEFNLTPLNHDQVEDALKYIKENDTVTVRFYKGAAFSALKGTRLRTRPKWLHLKRVQRSRSPCSSTRVK